MAWKKIFTGTSHIYSEIDKNPENSMKKYKKECKSRCKPIYLSYCRGIYSEGANLKNEESRIIALFGIPYLP